MDTPTTSTYEEALKKCRVLDDLIQPVMQGGDEVRLQKTLHWVLAAGQKHQYESNHKEILDTLDTASIVAKEIRLEVDLIICALLHSSAKDIAYAAIEKTLGRQIAQTIRKLTIIAPTLQWEVIQDDENAKAYIASLIQDPRATLIKMAETLRKMRVLHQFSRATQQVIASHAHHIYAPIAHRIGLYKIRAELEDLYLRATNTTIYQNLVTQLHPTKDADERFIKRFVQPIQNALQQQSFSFIIKTRVKSISSIQHKMQAIGLRLEGIYDIFAARIILDVPVPQEKLSCWQVYQIVTNLYKPHPSRFRNWLSYPRHNGYQSLHTTVMSNEGVWVEVQIRTQRMDHVAEKGSAAHWKYKGEEHLSSLEAWFNQARDTLAVTKNEKHTSNVMHGIRSERAHACEIRVFTHNNSVVTLPARSTVLDCAFALGTGIGLRCTGGWVNNELTAYHTPLHQGDRVHITSTTVPQARISWLDCVVTEKAKRTLRAFLQREEKRCTARGKGLVKQQLQQLHMTWDKQTVEKLLTYFDEQHINVLYRKVGEGTIALQHLRHAE